MAEFVEIEHPNVDGRALVPQSSVEHHKKAGWKLVPKKESAINAAADKKES